MWIFEKLKEKTNVKEDDTMIFNKIADEWLEYKKTNVKESTYYNYLFVVEKHLKPKYNNVSIESIINYNDFVQELSEKLEPKTVKCIISVLSSIFKYYEDEYDCRLIQKKVNLPKLEKKRLTILNKRNRNKLEKYCIDENTLKSLGIVIVLNTGLRVGEICALRWENIDFEEKVINITKTTQRVYDSVTKKSKVIIDKPKTENSMRSIPMSKKLYEILQPMKKNYKASNFFLSGTNEWIEPRAYQHNFKVMLKNNKIKSNKFHILRHTFASNCIEVGMDIKSLSEILGHSDINITLRTYVHSSDKIKKKYLNKL